MPKDSNLASKSRAERRGDAPVEVSISRRHAKAIDQALEDMVPRKVLRPGKKERARTKARVLQAQTLSPIRPYVTQEMLLGHSHTRGFKGPGMGKNGHKPAKPHKVYDLDGYTERRVDKALKRP